MNWVGDWMTITESDLSDNTASDGGGLYNRDGQVTVTLSRLERNVATGLGGGLYSYIQPTMIVDSVLSENTANNGGRSITTATPC